MHTAGVELLDAVRILHATVSVLPSIELHVRSNDTVEAQGLNETEHPKLLALLASNGYSSVVDIRYPELDTSLLNNSINAHTHESRTCFGHALQSYSFQSCSSTSCSATICIVSRCRIPAHASSAVAPF